MRAIKTLSISAVLGATFFALGYTPDTTADIPSNIAKTMRGGDGECYRVDVGGSACADCDPVYESSTSNVVIGWTQCGTESSENVCFAYSGSSCFRCTDQPDSTCPGQRYYWLGADNEYACWDTENADGINVGGCQDVYDNAFETFYSTGGCDQNDCNWTDA